MSLRISAVVAAGTSSYCIRVFSASKAFASSSTASLRCCATATVIAWRTACWYSGLSASNCLRLATMAMKSKKCALFDRYFCTSP